jgi:hypothetical protein
MANWNRKLTRVLWTSDVVGLRTPMARAGDQPVHWCRWHARRLPLSDWAAEYQLLISAARVILRRRRIDRRPSLASLKKKPRMRRGCKADGLVRLQGISQ